MGSYTVNLTPAEEKAILLKYETVQDGIDQVIDRFKAAKMREAIEENSKMRAGALDDQEKEDLVSGLTVETWAEKLVKMADDPIAP